MNRPRTRTVAAAFAASALLLAACASAPPDRREVAVALTASNQLIRFNAGRPDRISAKRPVSGLQPGEQLLGIDFRAKNDTLYALGSSGRLYTVDVETGAAVAVGAPLAVPLRGQMFGLDFNPTVDRIRVVSDAGLNMRLHPDTGAVVDANADAPGVQTDAAPAYDTTDAHAGKPPRPVAAAYSYNKANPAITTNYAIDLGTAALVTQGSREGVQPVVSPNSGRLFTVGSLNCGPFIDASFDIHVLTDAGFAALTEPDGKSSRWVELNLATGRAKVIGTIGGGEAVRAVALESW